MYLLLLFLTYGQPESPQPGDMVQILLSSSNVTSFRNWMILLDDSDKHTFSEKGQLELEIPAGSLAFEIMDPEGRSRFLGLWQQYNRQEQVRVEIPPASMILQQVVSASRMAESVWEAPAEIEVIRPDEQKERAPTQTSDWLKEQAEVVMQKTNLGGGSPIMRGVSGNRVLLMVDGFRLNNAIFRLGLNQYLNTIPGSQLEQIEVLSGPSGVQYGSDGLGGTVHLRSAEPGASPLNFGYQGLFSSADQTNGHTLTSSYGNEKWGYSGHLKINDYRDLRAASPVGDQTPTGYNAWDGSLNFRFQLAEHLRLKSINTFSDARHVPRTDRILSGRDLLWEYNPQIQQLNGIRLESTKQRAWADYFELGVGYLYQREGNDRISASRPERLRITNTEVDTIQANGTFRKITERAVYVYGFDFQTDQVDATGTEINNGGAPIDIGGKFPNDAAYQSVGLFASGDFSLTESMRLRAGLRQTFTKLEGTLDAPIGAVDQDNDQLTPSLNWSWEKNQWWVSLGASQGFRAPNLEDTLSVGPSNQGFDAPNPNIEPEILWSYDATIRWRNENSLLSATLYTSRYDELIEKVPGTYLNNPEFEGEPVFILDNVGEAQIDGVSVSFRRAFSSELSLFTDASYVYGQQTTRQEPTSRQPPLRGNLGFRFEKAKQVYSLLWSWADRQDRLSPSDIADSRIPETGTPGYGVVHLRGQYQFTKNLGLQLSVENLFDKLYKQHGSGIYEPGRRLLLGVQARWR